MWPHLIGLSATVLISLTWDLCFQNWYCLNLKQCATSVTQSRQSLSNCISSPSLQSQNQNCLNASVGHCRDSVSSVCLKLCSSVSLETWVSEPVIFKSTSCATAVSVTQSHQSVWKWNCLSVVSLICVTTTVTEPVVLFKSNSCATDVTWSIISLSASSNVLVARRSSVCLLVQMCSSLSLAECLNQYSLKALIPALPPLWLTSFCLQMCLSL